MSAILVVFFVIFGVSVVTILSGFFRTARMSSKIFEVVERQLDQSLTGVSAGQSTLPNKAQCEHCGSSVLQADKCPNCGASLISSDPKPRTQNEQ